MARQEHIGETSDQRERTLGRRKGGQKPDVEEAEGAVQR